MCRENQKNILCVIIFIFENRAVYEITRKYIVELERPQTTITHVACAPHAVDLRLQTHTQNM